MDERKDKKQKPQGKTVRELTAEQKRTVEEVMREGLTGADTFGEIHRAVNEKLGFLLSKPSFKKMMDDVREGFLIASGVCRESLQILSEARIRKVLVDEKAAHETAMKAIDRAHRLFDLKRRPEEDREAIAKVVEMEMTRIRGLSDDALTSYAETLKDPRLDEDFNNLIEAYKRGRIFAFEQQDVIDKATHTHNVTHKTRVRKPQKKKPQPSGGNAE